MSAAYARNGSLLVVVRTGHWIRLRLKGWLVEVVQSHILVSLADWNKALGIVKSLHRPTLAQPFPLCCSEMLQHFAKLLSQHASHDRAKVSWKRYSCACQNVKEAKSRTSHVYI